MDKELEAREHIEEMVDDPVWFEIIYGKLSLDFWREVEKQFNVKRLLTIMFDFYIASQRSVRNLTFEQYIKKNIHT